MTRINAAIDRRQLADARGLLTPAQYTRAARSAINETIRTGITQLSRLIRGELNLPVAEIKSRMRPMLAGGALEGSITISRKAVPLIQYGARETKKGVTVKVRRSGPRELLKQTFIARMRSGHEGVFERRGRAGKRVRRLPIDERMGPTVVGVLAGKPGMLDDATDKMIQKLADRFASKVDFILAGGRVGKQTQ